MSRRPAQKRVGGVDHRRKRGSSSTRLRQLLAHKPSRLHFAVTSPPYGPCVNSHRRAPSDAAVAASRRRRDSGLARLTTLRWASGISVVVLTGALTGYAAQAFPGHSASSSQIPLPPPRHDLHHAPIDHAGPRRIGDHWHTAPHFDDADDDPVTAAPNTTTPITAAPTPTTPVTAAPTTTSTAAPPPTTTTAPPRVNTSVS